MTPAAPRGPTGRGIWLPGAALEARRAAARGPLAPLARSLAADLEPFLGADLPLPGEKARLSRAGGRCPRDGTYLTFDPRSPRRHSCPACGASYGGDEHHRWWIMGFHLWLAERAVHAAALHALLGDDRHRRFAEDVLARYADAYPGYPNADNVLGPSRPFFSTYLESLWLLQLCVALDLLETVSGPAALGAAVRERLIVPSSELIASYDEGSSNRQVWNDAALLAAGLALGDLESAGRVIEGPSGVRALLSGPLLPDGTWFEGENYHQFAHRGLWYCAHLAGVARHDALTPEQRRRLDAGFAAPFLTALPDFTAPARRDSQYAVSLRQWRFAEMAELGLARNADDPVLRAALATLYDGTAPVRDTGRWRSTGEAERNEPQAALDRASLGWRSLLFALPELPPLTGAVPRSVLLESQGLAVFRRDRGCIYVALDYGHCGGGHGHPDRLGALYADGAHRWIDDPGTGSYVDASLHWYRGTLAHCAPMVDGRSQRPASGVLAAWDERGGVGWVDARVSGAAPGVELRRALVVFPDYFVDELSWAADRDVTVELPLHGQLALDGVSAWEEHTVAVDGAEYLSAVERPGPGATAPEGMVWRLRPAAGEAPVAWLTSAATVQWWRAMAPGAPGHAAELIHVAGARGTSGRILTVWSGRSRVSSVRLDGDVLEVRMLDGTSQSHRRTDAGWHIDLAAGGARSAIDLGGARTQPPVPSDGALADARACDAEPPPAPHSLSVPFRAALGEREYRRSELAWERAGKPTARVAISAPAGALVVDVAVESPAPCFAPPDARNDMDNERPEINSDGVQLHLRLPALATEAEPDPSAGWLLAPLTDGGMRVIALDPLAEGMGLTARWAWTPGGYSVHAAIPARELTRAPGGPVPVGVGIVVNETTPERERRRGQLVLGGARGEYVYLRGDRHPTARCLPFLLPDA